MDRAPEFRGAWADAPGMVHNLPDFIEPTVPELEPDRVLTPAELQEMLAEEGRETIEVPENGKTGWALPEFEDDDDDDESSVGQVLPIPIDESKIATDGIRAAAAQSEVSETVPSQVTELTEPTTQPLGTGGSAEASHDQIEKPILIKPIVEISDMHDAVDLPAASEPEVEMVDAQNIQLDDRMALSQNMVISAKGQTGDGAEYHALAGHVARLSKLNETNPLPKGLAAVGRKIYVLDNSLPGVPSLPDEMLGTWAKVLKMDIMEPDGILSSLDTDQLAELFGTAANHEDPRAAMMSKDLMYNVVDTLAQFPDPRTGDPRAGAVTMYEVRDAIRIMRGARQMPLSGVFEAPTIDPTMAKAIEDAFIVSAQDSIATYFEMLRVLVTEVVGRDTPEQYRVNEVPLSRRRELTAQLDDERNRPAPGGVTVISTGVNAKGKLGLWAQTMIGASAASAVIANAPLSTGLLVVRKLDLAGDLVGAQHALNVAHSHHIPTLATTEINDKVLPAIANADLALGKLHGPQAEMVAPYTGIRTRTDMSGKSTGTSGTTGSGGHQGDSDNFRDIPAVGGRMEPNKESTGLSRTNDASYNHATNDGKSASVGPGANIRADENSLLLPGEVVMVDAGGTHAYDVSNTAYTRNFPPQADESFGAKEGLKIAHVEARVQEDLRVSEQGKVVGLQPPAKVPEIVAGVQRPESSANVALPHKHAQEIGMRYEQYERRVRATGEKPVDWRVWIDREHAAEVTTYRQEWQQLRAVDPDTMPFEQWVHGEQSLRTWAERHGVLNTGMEQYIERRLQQAEQTNRGRGRYL